MLLKDPDFYMYLIMSYVVIWVCGKLYRILVGNRLWKARPLSPVKRRGLILVAIILPLLPYAVIEVQTQIWGSSMLHAIYGVMNHSDPRTPYYVEGVDVIYLKVLVITPRSAQVYFVTRRPASGDSHVDQALARYRRGYAYSGYTLDVIHTGKGWVYKGGFIPYWSDTGIGHGEPYPPYPSFGDFP